MKHSPDFVHTGPDTLAGKYLRMFWQPVYRSEDLGPGNVVPIRIMSEDFTLYRGESGTAHVVAPRCPHRGTQLSVGLIEGDCLRCHYHGWKFEGSGQCVEQPGEDESFASKVKIASYPTREYLGLIFAYFGAGDPPAFRRYPDFDRPGVLKAGVPEIWPCNFFNRLENGINCAHVLYTHRTSTLRANRRDLLVLRKGSYRETGYGIEESQSLEGMGAQHVHFYMPNTNQPRSQARVEGSLEDAARLWVDRLFWYVPIDDESCVTFVVDLIPLVGEEARAYETRYREARAAITTSPNDVAEAILKGKMRLKDIDERTSTYYLFWVEDYLSMVGQGSIPDRSNERLGRLDAGIILLRKIWERELRALADHQPLKQWAVPPQGLRKEETIRLADS